MEEGEANGIKRVAGTGFIFVEY